MTNSIRLGAVAILLAAAAIVTSPHLWGDPGQAKKDGKGLLPSDNQQQPPGNVPGTETERALANSKFAAGGLVKVTASTCPSLSASSRPRTGLSSSGRR